MTTQEQIIANLVALGFSNDSAVAIYNKLSETFAIPVDNTVNEIANSEAKITNLLISEDGFGKSEYYTSAALAFQYGDNLVKNMAINPDTGEPYLNWIYETIDATKQIIAQAAFDEIDTGNAIQLILKVATIDPITGLLSALSPLQLAAFQSYMLTFEIPGLPLTIISIAGNVLKFNAVATYSSIYDLSTLQINLAAALTSFQDTFQFNGVLYMGQLQDYIKNNVAGVIDFYPSSTMLDGVPFGGFIPLPSGYFNFDAAVITSITYNSVQA